MGELNMVRFLLNIIVFVSGAVLMGLEIVGSRVLAPYFGSSIFVWGSLISVVLAALSIGYYWGGWLSAREPSYGRLLTLLLIPGIQQQSQRSEEHTSELQSRFDLVCRLLLEKKKNTNNQRHAKTTQVKTKLI